MSRREYYWRWIRTAFRDCPGWIDLWLGMASAILTALTHFVPSVQADMPDLPWQILFWVVVSIIVARLVLAPYWIAEEDAVKIKGQQREIDELREKIKPQLLIAGVIHDPELASSAMQVMRHIKIEVRNTGVEILQHCLVTLEKLTSDKGYTQPEKADLISEMTFRAGEPKYVEVAWLNEGLPKSEVELQYQSPAIQRTIPRDDTYYFNLVAYSVGSPFSKRFKLYVDNDGRLRMEESPQ